MDRDSLINAVVEAYFDGGDWKGLLKDLVKGTKSNTKGQENGK